MPYKSVSDLPKNLKTKYDDTAQRAFLHAFNSCWESHPDEGRCFATGYAAANQSQAKRSKKGTSLREKVIRLAHTRPDLREHLLPILKTSAQLITDHTTGSLGIAYIIDKVRLDRRVQLPNEAKVFVFGGTAQISYTLTDTRNALLARFKWGGTLTYYPTKDYHELTSVAALDGIGKPFEGALRGLLRYGIDNEERDEYRKMRAIIKKLLETS